MTPAERARELLKDGRELEGVLELLRFMWLEENPERRASASREIDDIRKRATA